MSKNPDVVSKPAGNHREAKCLPAIKMPPCPINMVDASECSHEPEHTIENCNEYSVGTCEREQKQSDDTKNNVFSRDPNMAFEQRTSVAPDGRSTIRSVSRIHPPSPMQADRLMAIQKCEL